MPKKRGGRAKDQRLLQPQNRALSDKEMAKKKEETMSLYLKDKLRIEQRNTEKNLQEINQSWERILRQCGKDELREDVAVLRQTFERQVDELDAEIQKLLGNLQNAEHQVAKEQQSHLQAMDALWAQHERQLSSLTEMWDSAMEDLSTTFNSQMQTMLVGFEQSQVKLKDQALYVEQQHKDMEKKFKEKEEKIQDQRYMLKYLKERHQSEMLKDQTVRLKDSEKKFKEKEEKIQDQRDMLKDQPADPKKKPHSEQMDSRGSKLNMSEIQQQLANDLRKVKRLQDEAYALRQQVKKEQVDKLQDLSASKDKVRQEFLELQDQMTRDRKKVKKNMAELSLPGNAYKKRLEAIVTKGNEILWLDEMCRKLENKIKLPPYSSENRQAVCEFGELENVTQRLEAAILQRNALRDQQKHLKRENQQLELCLNNGSLEQLPLS